MRTGKRSEKGHASHSEMGLYQCACQIYTDGSTTSSEINLRERVQADPSRVIVRARECHVCISGGKEVCSRRLKRSWAKCARKPWEFPSPFVPLLLPQPEGAHDYSLCVLTTKSIVLILGRRGAAECHCGTLTFQRESRCHETGQSAMYVELDQ